MATGYIESDPDKVRELIKKEAMDQARLLIGEGFAIISNDTLKTILAVFDCDERAIKNLQEGKEVNGAEIAFVNTGRLIAIRRINDALNQSYQDE